MTTARQTSARELRAAKQNGHRVGQDRPGLSLAIITAIVGRYSFLLLLLLLLLLLSFAVLVLECSTATGLKSQYVKHTSAKSVRNVFAFRTTRPTEKAGFSVTTRELATHKIRPFGSRSFAGYPAANDPRQAVVQTLAQSRFGSLGTLCMHDGIAASKDIVSTIKSPRRNRSSL